MGKSRTIGASNRRRNSSRALSGCCAHPRVVFRKHADKCWWAVCALCGQRGPRKHSRPLARARMRSVGTAFRWSPTHEQWSYTRTAAIDDLFTGKRNYQEKI